jgi:dihydrofolate synthase/folylpolyglutamate synthase
VQWFVDENVDVMVLEVGMGGRLDAVNVFDADCAILTNVDLDHQAFLGDTREAIGFEKAGIFRVNKPAICVDPVPPASVLKQAKDIGADLWRFGVDFGYVADTNQWNYKGKNRQRAALAYPALRGTNQLLNATGALAALEALDFCLPVSQQAVREGFARVELSGRFQVLAGQPTRVLDVAHNPHAAAVLAQNLSHMGFYTQTHAVIGILADKDVLGTLTPLADEIDVWYAAPLPSDRSLSLPDLLGMIRQVAKKEAKVLGFDRVDLALAAAENQLKMAPENPQQGLGERLVVFGSFLTVSAALDFYQKT